MLDTNDSFGYVDIVWINSEILIVSSVSTKDGDPVIKLQKIIVENARGVERYFRYSGRFRERLSLFGIYARQYIFGFLLSAITKDKYCEN